MAGGKLQTPKNANNTKLINRLAMYTTKQQTSNVKMEDLRVEKVTLHKSSIGTVEILLARG